MENNYAFRRELLTVHQPARRRADAVPPPDSLLIDDGFEIHFPQSAGRVLRHAAQDLAEYLSVSQQVYVRTRPIDNAAQASSYSGRRILLGCADAIPSYAPAGGGIYPYRMVCDGENIVICGESERATAQGVYYLEDLMTLAECPAVPIQDITRKSLYSPRMIHSGYGLDMYPDAHLRAIAHTGMDAVLVFVKDVDRTPHGYLDFNELIWRAEGFGLDVYAYSYFISEKHPDEPDARAHYESTYGRLFAACPGLRGVVLVGESMEFPSRDEHTTGRPYYESTPENNPDRKPSPGWYPCHDYPQWLSLVKEVIRDKRADADIVFWSYNWGYVDAGPRIELIRRLPTDISLLVTFEMFENLPVNEQINRRCVDYTLFFEGPGKYFISEAEEAARRGIRLYAMANTGGLTWDIGVIPYEPAPYQWKRRWDALEKAHTQWGLCGLMESHHFGFWPSFIAELAKWAYWTPSVSFDEVIRRIAGRDFGAENTESVLEVWQLWSDGIRKYISVNADQYGPFRIGPAYPLLFEKNAQIPTVPHAHFGGNHICNPMYAYAFANLETIEYEMDSLAEMQRLFDAGADILQKTLSGLSGERLLRAERMVNLGRFIARSAQTTVHVKQWYLLKLRLLGRNQHGSPIWSGGGQGNEASAALTSASTREEKRVIIEQMCAVAEEELANAQRTLPLVDFDSRLGFEPSMEYIGDRAHIEWKCDVTRRAVTEELLPLLQTL